MYDYLHNVAKTLINNFNKMFKKKNICVHVNTGSCVLYSENLLSINNVCIRCMK